MSYPVDAAASSAMDEAGYSTAPRHLQGHRFSPYTQDGALPTQSNDSYPQHHPLDPSLAGLEPGNGFHHGYGQPLDDSQAHAQQLQLGLPFGRSSQAFQDVGLPQTPQQQQQQQQQAGTSAGQFGMLTPQTPLQGQNQSGNFAQNTALEKIQAEHGLLQARSASGAGKKDGGHFVGMKHIPNPPDLDAWRQRLFDVEGTITLTEEEFQTYFTHVDNVYSHRSTQRYKRKPFVSHYWDCRLKGRPPGTPKSDDPNKKKRKRQARERDLCDVKIKITEYFPDARSLMGELGEEPNDGTIVNEDLFAGSGGGFPTPTVGSTQQFSTRFMGPEGAQAPPAQVPGANGERYYTVSRVNGSNGNGKGDGVPGPHKHGLEESDRVKKNSVLRKIADEEKTKKKEQKTYHKRATGAALSTVKRHSKDSDLKLFGSCFCPFVQRLWIAMEHKALQYQYIEIDPYKKPPSLLALNPLGLVPALTHNAPNQHPFSCHESVVLMEYIEDAFSSSPPTLLGSTPQARAHARLWADHVNKKIIPAFYHTLQAQNVAFQDANAKELSEGIETLVRAADPEGPFFAGPEIGWVDVMLAPWLLRLSRVMAPYRGWPEPDMGSRWGRMVQAVECCEAVRATTSGGDLYRDSYERYAENRPNTSQVADAVDSGRGLP